MHNKTVDDNIKLAQDTGNNLAYDLEQANSLSDEEGARMLSEYLLHSEMYSSTGNIYITDVLGRVISRNIVDQSMMPDGDIRDGVFSITDESLTDLIEKASVSRTQETDTLSRTNEFEVITCTPIGDTGNYLIVMHSVDMSDARSEYFSVVLVPALIALLVSVALFIGFVTISMRPLREISRVITRVSEGDYSARVGKKYTESNELSLFSVSSDLAEMGTTLNNMLEMLENQEKDRGIFISSVAHDIRTPLTSINGFVTAMTDGTIPPENHRKYLVMIKNEADRIRRLVSSMTEASSLTHVDPEMMESFNVEEMLEDIVSNLEPQLKEKKIDLKTVYEVAEPVAYGEPQPLCRVVVNIISNAIKFTPIGGNIRVTVARTEDGKRIQMNVEDSGPGVDEDKRARVFESFYKADPSRKQAGFGLGLYICKQILVGHGQSIVLDESTDLGGANFIFTLPTPHEDR
ncbi:MAG: HAMP domain-containing histidine kinase [Clostridiales bacterium]|nr:HAMP domain-containing histidine kinase [Clostridiales bacterium]